MLSPSAIGEKTEAQILAALLQQNVAVLTPFGSHLRYDLVFEKDCKFYRVQCKTARLRDNVVRFNANSRTDGVCKSYKGEVDFLAAYCPDNGANYLVPVEEVPGSEVTLRLEAPVRYRNMRWASDYLLSDVIGRLHADVAQW